ncbi:hypothetical protein [Gluconobacter oxydans]|uniref:hypothetical protein n=1 Tax=Gluconobacter oxydans TaxID=442 RepID=UPI0015584A35|nr:hypothetical protein [Gluconobacter oxydans]
MSEEDKIYRLPDALERKGIHLKCPICGQDSFSVSPQLREYIIPAMDKNKNYNMNVDLGNPIYTLVCNSCSYVLCFSIPIADSIVDAFDADE